MNLDLTDYLSGEYRSYSGRGMYGKQCRGFVYESLQNAVRDMLLAVASLEDQDDRLASEGQLGEAIVALIEWAIGQDTDTDILKTWRNLE